MKICIYGAGVIGGILASAIQRGGHKVSLIARGDHLRAIQERGLTLTSGDWSAHTRHVAVDHPTALPKQDLIIVATKTTSHRDVARDVGSIMASHTRVAFAMNGIFWFYAHSYANREFIPNVRRLDRDGLIAAAFPAERTLGIIAMTGGELTEPGIIKASHRDTFFSVGPAVSGLNAADSFFGDLTPADITMSWADDIRLEMWRKYISNVGNFAPSCLTTGTMGQVHGSPGVRNVQLALAAEAHSVAVAHGYTQLSSELERLRSGRSRSPHKPSMLQDLERGRAMEVDSVYLVLQDLARQAGVPTPVLDVIAPLLCLRAQLAGCYRDRASVASR